MEASSPLDCDTGYQLVSIAKRLQGRGNRPPSLAGEDFGIWKSMDK